MIGGMHTTSIEQGTWPRDLAGRIPKDYAIDSMVHWGGGPDVFAASAFAMLEKRHGFFMDLVREQAPDVVMPVYVALDRICHAFFGYDPAGYVRKVYEAVDRIIDDWSSLAQGHGAMLLLASDHGFSRLKYDLYPNALLMQNGLMAFSPEKIRAARLAEPPDDPDPRHRWHRDLMHRQPLSPLPSDDGAIAAGIVDARYKSFQTVDWSKTLAYAHGLSCGVYLNLKGREPQGAVSPGEEADRVLDRIASLFLSLKNELGEAVIEKVHRKEDLYRGDALELAPDLILQPSNWEATTRGGVEFLSNDPIGRPAVNHTGHHRPNACFGVFGDGALQGAKGICSLADFAPTLLHLAGAPVPEHIEGRVLTGALTPAFMSRLPVRMRPAMRRIVHGDAAAAERNEQAIRDRLKGLGYLG